MASEARDRLRAGLDPRRPIYRDRFNEYFVFLLSAAGASVLVPLLLFLVAAIAGQFSVVIFVVAAVLLELFLIFGVGRPQMQRIERAGWALLWGTGAAFFALCFYYLVLDNLI